MFHKICIFLTLKNFKNKDYKLIVITSSSELKKKIIQEKKFSDIQINLITDINFFKKIWFFFKEVLLLIINISLIKIKSTNKKINNINLIDIFEIEEKKNYSFYGDFLKKNFPKKNYYLVPTFLTFSPLKIYKLLKQKRYFFFKESEISFIDIFSILKNFIFNSVVLKKSFLNNNFDCLIKEEIRIDNNFRSILIANLNYYFFKNLKKKKIKVFKIISWFENQIVDKGWSMGVNHFYPNVEFIGYQAATLHPQFFNLSPTKTEAEAKILPKKIFLIGKKYIKNRKMFYKKSIYQITPFNRFNFVQNTKNKKNYLFLLSGIKHCDEYLLSMSKNFARKFGQKNVFIKFHPILPSKSFKGIYANEIRGNGSDIIQKSKVVVTSSYTSGLYESLVYNSYTIMIDFTPLDGILYKELKKYSKYILFCKNSKDLFNIIKSLNIQKVKNIKKHNTKVKKIFFNR